MVVIGELHNCDLRHKAAFECVLSLVLNNISHHFIRYLSVLACMSFCLLYVCILCISVFMYFMYSVCLSVSLSLFIWAKLPEINCVM